MTLTPIVIFARQEGTPLRICPHFKSLSHDKILSTLKTYGICMNCLRPGHVSKQCHSLNQYRKCQKPHHNLLHTEAITVKTSYTPNGESIVSSNHAATGITSSTLLMTCEVTVKAPDGTSIRARALLDSASSASFVSECLVQGLNLPRISRSHHNLKISGIAGLSRKSPL